MLLSPEKTSTSDYFPISGYAATSESRYFGTAAISALKTATVPGYTAGNWVSQTAILSEDELEVLLRNIATQQWLWLVSDKHSPTDRRSLKKTAKATFDVINRSGPGELDLWLLEVGKVSGPHLAMVLRCAFPWKDKISGWDRAMTIARWAVMSEGRKPKEVLFGLT
jgi:hypothetical protein